MKFKILKQDFINHIKITMSFPVNYIDFLNIFNSVDEQEYEDYEDEYEDEDMDVEYYY